MSNFPIAANLATGRITAGIGVQASTLIPDAFAYLTPDALIAYCASKMRGVDNQIQSIFARQQGRNAKMQVLSELQQTLSNYKIGFEKNADARAQIEAAIQKAETAFAGDPELSSALAKLKEGFNAMMEDEHASSDEMTGYLSSVQAMQQSLNQSGELEMMQMQSLMSQRQQSIQLVTNMLQSLNQASQGVCANVGK